MALEMSAARPDPLAIIATRPPPVAAADAVLLARRHYGLDVTEAVELVSERDRNFRLTEARGRRYVLKITNSAEERQVTFLQIEALRHVAQRAPDLAVPRIVPADAGSDHIEIESSAGRHIARLATWLEGVPLRERSLAPGLARDFGAWAARLGRALEGFDHPGAAQSLLWDMQQVESVASLVQHIGDGPLRARVAECLRDFASRLLPCFPRLRRQVIHNDLNPDNVLVTAGEPDTIAGVIDFGDMVRAPLIVDIAIAASYMRNPGADPLALIAPFVAAYHELRPLSPEELVMLPDLIRVRLATTVAIMHWRRAVRGPGDPYLRQNTSSEGGAADFLVRLDGLPPATAADRLSEICQFSS